MGLDDLCSFSADTLVTTSEGTEAISTLEVGDNVLAYLEATGEIDYYPIVASWAHEDPFIVYLTIDGETIETTPEHPFYIADNAWVAAGDLWLGARVRKSDGSYGTVQAIEVVERPQVMYNLTVDEAHTFFVGREGWLVHNACRTTTAHRVEGTPNQRFEVDANGNVTLISGDDGMLHISFGDRSYAYSDYFLAWKKSSASFKSTPLYAQAASLCRKLAVCATLR